MRRKIMTAFVCAIMTISVIPVYADDTQTDQAVTTEVSTETAATVQETKRTQSKEQLKKKTTSKKHTKTKKTKLKKKEENKKLDVIKLVILTILLIALIVVSIVLIVKRQTNDDEQDDKVLAYTELVKEIQNKNVEKIEMTVGSTTLKVKLKDEEEEKKAIIPNTQVFMELIQSQTLEGNEIKLEQKTRSVISQIPSYFFSILPTAIMVALFIMIYKMQGLGDKGQVYEETERKTKITFDDIAGLDEEKAELKEIVEFLKEPKRFTEMGAKIPKGVLLYGKPGTGKTLIAKAIAGEADVPFISMSGSEFIEMFAGLGASRVRKLFEKARKISPCIVFIDEIDAIGSRRTSNSGAETENNQTLNQLLVEMDGFSSEETIIVLAATNRPEMLDKALLRPGRFDRQIVVGLPDVRAREQILEVHARKKKLADDIDLKIVAKNTAGFSGADLENVLNEAALLAARRNLKEIHEKEIEDAMVKVTMGPEKTTRVRSEKEKRLVAYHEAGHAVVSKFLPTQDAVHEISIVPRGMAGGYTMYQPTEDKSFMSKTEMIEQIISLLGGRASEELILDDISTGASNDIERATKIANSMVTKYGMSQRVGTITLGSDQNEVFLGRDFAQEKTYSEETAGIIDEEMKRILDTCYNSAKEILKTHEDKLHAVAKVLLEKEKITGEEFEAIFNEE